MRDLKNTFLHYSLNVVIVISREHESECVRSNVNFCLASRT